MNDRSARPRTPWARRARAAGVALAAAALAGTALVAPATAGPGTGGDGPGKAGKGHGQQHGKPGSSRALQRAVKVERVMDHLERFQQIADRHDGTRASGTPGYAASRDHVVRTLRRAGYRPRLQEFDFPFFRKVGPTTFEQLAPTSTTYVEDEDFGLMDYSGSGDATGDVQAVDLALDDLPGSTSGCEAEDFAGFTAGNVALVRRGGCPFGQKVVNAQDAGASAVIVMNTGTDGATEAFAGSLGGPVGTVPAVGTSFEIGRSLADGARVRLAASTESDVRQTWNVLAETRQGSRGNVVMAGAHLDSAVAGEGINDNGSGSAALLEVAVQLARTGVKPRNQVRFAWWGAEELGLLGSEHYVADLAGERPRELERIALYLNFDMVASPNYALFVYDGDNSAFPVGPGAAEGPEGSGAIEALFHEHFADAGLSSDESPFTGRSDYGPFIEQGIPAGGLFTGSEGIKTPEQAERFGGEAGQPFDPCYHLECDDLDNVSVEALDANSDAIAHAVHTYARSTRSVNGRGARDGAGRGGHHKGHHGGHHKGHHKGHPKGQAEKHGKKKGRKHGKGHARPRR